MCERVIQASGPDRLGLNIVSGADPDVRFSNFPPRYNKLKHFRAVATRFEKHDANDLALV